MKYLLLYNPISGRGNFFKKINIIKTRFAKENLHLDVYESKSQKDLVDKAYIESKNYYMFLVAGGDGTVNEVINGIMKSDVRPVVAIIPRGTANDTTAILGMKKRINKSLDIIINEKPIAIDVNRLNNKYFIYATAAGILTKISYDIDRKKIKKYGYLAYLAEGVRDLTKDYNFKMEITYDEGTVKGKFMLILALSARRVGGFNLRRFSEAKLNDGLLELRLIHYTKRSKLYKLFKFFILKGKKQRNDVQLTSKKYHIETENKVVWNIDGEKGIEGNATIEVLREELNVIASAKSKKKYFL